MVGLIMVQKYTDTEMLDFLQNMTNQHVYTGRVVCRHSTIQRGWRLHESSHEKAIPNVRQAIEMFIDENGGLGNESEES
jgi:hypothetical protein